MLGLEAMRFLRTRWKTTQHLAEELYAVFRDALTITPGRVVISPPAGSTEPALDLRLPPDYAGPAISISRGDVTTTFGATGGGGGGGSGGGGIDMGSITIENPGDTALAVPPPTENPFLLYGVVEAKEDAGSYLTAVYARDPAVAPPMGKLHVWLPMVDVGEEVPVGTVVPVLCFPGYDADNKFTVLRAYGFQPVYLPPAG